MATQEPGWSSSPLAGGLTPDNAWARDLRKKYGTGRQDDIIAYGIQNDSLMNRTISDSFRSRGGSGGGGSDWLGSGSVNMRFGGGNTPSNPGAYNYDTLSNTVGNAVGAVKWGFNTRSKLRANQEKQDRVKKVQEANDWNSRVLPYGLEQHNKKQKDFNQPRSPATGKPSKAKNAKPMQGPVPTPMNMNLNPKTP
jgi:hypothetical protein